MGSCVSKKAARAGAGAGVRKGKVAAPLPVVEKESSAARGLPPVAEVAEEEEVKEVVLSETPAPRPPRPPPEPVKRRKEQPEAEEESASEACSATSDSASVESAAMEKAKAKAKAKLQKAGEEREVEKRAVDAPEKRRTAPEERESKPKGRGATNGRARSPSPSSAHRRQQQPVSSHQHQHHPPAPRPRREQPPVVSGIGCRSGRFSPSAARRAAESAVRRTHSAREADMALPSKRSLGAAINGSALSRRDPGERSGRRSDSPTGRRAPASPSATHRAASPARKAAKEHGTPERARPRARDCDEQPAGLAGSGGGERKKVAEGEEGALGQNPSVAMECFIFL